MQTDRRRRRFFAPTAALVEALEPRMLLTSISITGNVNPATTDVNTNDQESPAVDASLNGTVVIAWEHEYSSTDTDIYFRRYTTTGVPLDAANRSVATSGNHELDPTVAVTTDGSRFVIGWWESAADDDAFFSIYNANGNFVRRVQVFGNESNNQSQIDLAVMADGRIVAVWTELGATDNVYARVFDRDGNALSGLISVATTLADEDEAAVATDLFGNFVVVYEHDNDSVARRHFRANGSPVGPRQFVTPGEITLGDEYENPDVAMAPTGNFVIVYQVDSVFGSASDHVYWNLYNAGGAKFAEGRATSSPGRKIEASVDMDLAGNFVVSFSRLVGTHWDVDAENFDSRGRRGNAGRLHIGTAGNQQTSAVALANNILVGAWRDDSGSTYDVEFLIFENVRSKIGVGRPNGRGGLTFFLDSNANLHFDAFDAAFNFGLVGDVIVTGDFGGNASDELGVARPNRGGGLRFFLDSNGNRGFDGGDAVFDFGLAGDIVVVGNWNGVGSDKLGVGRTNRGGGLRFFLDSNGNRGFDGGDAVFDFGLAGDIIVVGDWDGNGVDDLGVARRNGGGGLRFFLDSNGNRRFDPGDTIFDYGLAGDKIIVGDWDGNGVDDLGVVRPNAGGGLTVFPDINGNRVFDATDAAFIYNFGAAGDVVIIGAWPQTALRNAVSVAGGAVADSTAPSLTDSQLERVASRTIEELEEAGLDAISVQRLRNVTWQVGDLSGAQLGEVADWTVTIDANAAGYGWFVDPESDDTSALGRDTNAAVGSQVDLLAVVLHEMGHVLGHEHVQEGLIMRDVLNPGVRHDVEDLFADLDWLAVADEGLVGAQV
ncbi:MAG: hypothetical protein WBC44_19660 [Planctomycetaceae bacterium]